MILKKASRYFSIMVFGAIYHGGEEREKRGRERDRSESGI